MEPYCLALAILEPHFTAANKGGHCATHWHSLDAVAVFSHKDATVRAAHHTTRIVELGISVLAVLVAHGAAKCHDVHTHGVGAKHRGPKASTPRNGELV